MRLGQIYRFKNNYDLEFFCKKYNLKKSSNMFICYKKHNVCGFFNMLKKEDYNGEENFIEYVYQKKNYYVDYSLFISKDDVKDMSLIQNANEHFKELSYMSWKKYHRLNFNDNCVGKIVKIKESNNDIIVKKISTSEKKYKLKNYKDNLYIVIAILNKKEIVIAKLSNKFNENKITIERNDNIFSNFIEKEKLYINSKDALIIDYSLCEIVDNYQWKLNKAYKKILTQINDDNTKRVNVKNITTINEKIIEYDTREYNKQEKIEKKNIDIIIRKKNVYCEKVNHDNIQCIGLINIINKLGNLFTLEIPIFYCKNCDKYYMSELEYERIRRFGMPVCKIVTENIEKSNNIASYQMNSESELHSLGYNVNSIENLSDVQRKKILSTIVDLNLMTKKEIVNHLSYLINRSSNMKNFRIAIDKWTSDREYILDYKKGNINIYNIAMIKKRDYYQK